jgi:hypothetical protein
MGIEVRSNSLWVKYDVGIQKEQNISPCQRCPQIACCASALIALRDTLEGIREI